MTDAARAFVPGHLTGFFTTDPDPDPTRAGSRGAGLALSAGVTVTVEPARDGEAASPTESLLLDGESITVEAVDGVRDALGIPARARIRATTDVPLAAGFGVSGGLALGTALAANAVFDCRLSERELVTVAHGAEVRAGTGLGDVVAQARGGVPIRLEPGAPTVNDLDGIPERGRVEYHVIGDRSTAAVLDGDTDALTRAGERALAAVVAEPTLATLLRASRQFSRESELLTDGVRRVIEDVAEAGGSAAMGMLGETVFAPGRGLSDAGYDPSVCQVNRGGATVE